MMASIKQAEILRKICVYVQQIESVVHVTRFHTLHKQNQLLTALPAAASAPSCWQRSQLLTALPAAYSAPSFWQRSQLLTALPASDSAPSCWQRSQLLAALPAAGSAPSCWQRFQLLTVLPAPFNVPQRNAMLTLRTRTCGKYTWLLLSSKCLILVYVVRLGIRESNN
jgi:hypothetical protein